MSTAAPNGFTMGSTVPIDNNFFNMDSPKAVEFGLSTGGGVSSDVSIGIPVGKPTGKVFNNRVKLN